MQLALFLETHASFLPPAYVVRGKVIFILGNVCLFTFLGGGPRSRWGGTRSQVHGEGVPGPGQGVGGSQVQVGGGTQSQVWGGYPVSVKGKIFDTRFGLIHVQTGKKIFCRGIPPPPRNSKDLLWLRGGRYASCVHAGGLSCCD